MTPRNNKKLLPLNRLVVLYKDGQGWARILATGEARFDILRALHRRLPPGLPRDAMRAMRHDAQVQDADDAATFRKRLAALSGREKKAFMLGATSIKFECPSRAAGALCRRGKEFTL